MSEFHKKQRTGTIVANPPMIIAGADQAFPGTEAYGYAQLIWTSIVQKALSGLLTFYGKGVIVVEMIASFLHPGEDSVQEILLKHAENVFRRANLAKAEYKVLGSEYLRRSEQIRQMKSEHINYRWKDWLRPTFYSSGTEARYLWNVLLYIIDSIVRTALFGDSDLGYDVKNADMFLWQHYLNIPLVAVMITLLHLSVIF